MEVTKFNATEKAEPRTIDDMISLFKIESEWKTEKFYLRSKKYRLEGNRLFEKNKMMSALLNYNKSICWAEIGSINSGLAFANRAEVAFKLEKYDDCLKNIVLAKEHNYPEESMLKVIVRENDCLKLKNLPGETAKYNDFKLTYLPKAEIPFIINFLHLKKYKRKERFLASKSPLKAGDIVAIEAPFFGAGLCDSRFMICGNCLKHLSLDLIACDGCNSMMFCSQKCKEEANAGFHQYECIILDHIIECFSGYNDHILAIKIFLKALALCDGDIIEFQVLLNMNKRSSTYFDYNFTDPSFQIDKTQKLIAAHAIGYNMSFNSRTVKNEVLIFEKILHLYPKLKQMCTNNDVKDVIVKFLIKQLRCIQVRSNKSKNSRGKGHWYGGAYPLNSYMTHSCAPNIYIHINHECKAVYIVQSPIPAGAPLTISYTTDFRNQDKLERQSNLMEKYSFKCECIACQNNYPLKTHLKVVDVAAYNEVTKPGFHGFEIYNKNCEYINSHFEKNFPCKELIEMMCIALTEVLIRIENYIVYRIWL
ncbi:unnamed protein product [Diamesa serratosioi]